MVNIIHTINKIKEFIEKSIDKFKELKQLKFFFITLFKYAKNKIIFFTNKLKYIFTRIRIKVKLFFKNMFNNIKTKTNDKNISENIKNMNTLIYSFIEKHKDFFQDFNLHSINNDNLLNNHIIMNNNVAKIIDYCKHNINVKFETIKNINEFQSDLNNIFITNNKINNNIIGIVYINKNLKSFFKNNNNLDYQLYYNYLITIKDNCDTNYTRINKINNIINNKSSIYSKFNVDNEILLKNINKANNSICKPLTYF